MMVQEGAPLVTRGILHRLIHRPCAPALPHDAPAMAMPFLAIPHAEGEQMTAGSARAERRAWHAHTSVTPFIMLEEFA